MESLETTRCNNVSSSLTILLRGLNKVVTLCVSLCHMQVGNQLRFHNRTQIWSWAHASECLSLFFQSGQKHLLFFNSRGPSLDEGLEVEGHRGPAWEEHDLKSTSRKKRKKNGAKP